MSAPFDGDRGSSRRRGFNHWLPLAITLTLATAGVAAWVWSQRSQDDDEDDEFEDDELLGNGSGRRDVDSPNSRLRHSRDYEYGQADYDNQNYGGASSRRDAGGDSGSSAVGPTIRMTDNNATTAGWGTNNPQQWVGNASKAVTAGVAAASAAVGGALASIREGDKDDGAYGDHEAWEAEAATRASAKRDWASTDAATTTPTKSKDRKAKITTTTTTTTTTTGPTAPTGPTTGTVSRDVAAGATSSSYSKDAVNRKRKTVAIVVSADSNNSGDVGGFHEHASILSYIPRQTDFSKTRIFVLIYAPDMKETSTLEAQSPRDEIKNPISPNSSFHAVNAQALALVEKESDIIPFTSANGHAHILHLLEPDVIYLQESLTGDNGAIVTQLQNWMRNDIVVVVGAESGSGGLADSESEAEKPSTTTVKWWQKEERVGRGRGVVVVDGLRVNDDWTRRVLGRN